MHVPSAILASATPPTPFSCLPASPNAEPLTPIDGSWVMAPFGMVPAKPSPRLRDRIWAPCPEEETSPLDIEAPAPSMQQEFMEFVGLCVCFLLLPALLAVIL